MIIGIDEVGLGAWAGPLYVCAFAAPDEHWTLPGLNDSKKLSKKKRLQLAHALMQAFPNHFAIVSAPSIHIDELGIAVALRKSMEQSLEILISRVGVPERVIIDGEDKGIVGAEFYPRADGDYPAVMAASVIAKVARDTFMLSQTLLYPEYAFGKHVGYGTSQHREELLAHGPCPLHRRSYEPIKAFGSSATRSP